MKQSLYPDVFWAQQEESISLKIALKEVKVGVGQNRFLINSFKSMRNSLIKTYIPVGRQFENRIHRRRCQFFGDRNWCPGCKQLPFLAGLFHQNRPGGISCGPYSATALNYTHLLIRSTGLHVQNLRLKDRSFHQETSGRLLESAAEHTTKAALVAYRL
jgi:hypothetical protein